MSNDFHYHSYEIYLSSVICEECNKLTKFLSSVHTGYAKIYFTIHYPRFISILFPPRFSSSLYHHQHFSFLLLLTMVIVIIIIRHNISLFIYSVLSSSTALRGLFIIDPDGIIRSIQINDDAVGRSVEETLRILKAFQWADSHVGASSVWLSLYLSDCLPSPHFYASLSLSLSSLMDIASYSHDSQPCIRPHTLSFYYLVYHLIKGEACPASWTPGSDTIKTNPYESKEYFRSHYAADTL